VKLTVVGCSGSVPAADSSASSYLVQYDGFNLVLDLGQGSVGALQNHLELNAIDAIFLSHLHPDHCIDMTCLYVARRYGRDQPHALLPVHAPPGASDRLADAYGLDRVPGMSNTFSFHESAMTTAIGPFRVRTALMEHPVTNYAVRLDTPTGSLIYSGDTGPTDALAELADGADVLLCEASFVDGEDNPPNLHLTGKQAGEVAERAEVGRLVLTHIPPWNKGETALSEARTTFSGESQLARSGLAIELSR
jgi:ribonuclease BN (tRNA processing enzyme)